MTIGRTDDPQNPFRTAALEAASLLGSGSRTPSGPADMMPRQQAGHMIAIEPPGRFLIFPLASEGPSTHGTEGPVPEHLCLARHGRSWQPPALLPSCPPGCLAYPMPRGHSVALAHGPYRSGPRSGMGCPRPWQLETLDALKAARLTQTGTCQRVSINRADSGLSTGKVIHSVKF
jgi:hypothetical protein